jgi:superfamily II DNA or RNA helicase
MNQRSGLFALAAVQKTPVTIRRDDSGILVTPDCPAARKFLTLSYREMIADRRGRRVEFFEEPLYNVVASPEGVPSLVAYPGFWKSLAAYLRQQGHHVSVVLATKSPMEEPLIGRACIGLRPIQTQLVLNALMTGESGLIGAPTRFGKTYVMSAICRAFPNARTLVTAPGVDLCRQLYEHFSASLRRDVRGIFSGGPHKKPGNAINVCSVDSLHKMDPDATDLMLIDEPHAIVSAERLDKVVAFSRARKYGFGATLTGRFDKKDRLIEGIIGPVIAEVTYKEAVAAKAISPLVLALIEIPFSHELFPRAVGRDTVYERLLTKSMRVARLIRRIVDEAIPKDWQTMMFIKDESQAEFFLRYAVPEEGTIAMAKRMTAKERKALTERIRTDETKRLLASNIYVQGVTFPGLKLVVNLAGGGANTTTIQKPGRLLQAMEGKNYGVMIDFLFTCGDAADDDRRHPPYSCVVGESQARLRAYHNIGYEVRKVKSMEQLKKIMEGSYAASGTS